MEFTNLSSAWFAEKHDCLVANIPKDIMFIIKSYCVGPFIGKNNYFDTEECKEAHQNAGFKYEKCAKCGEEANYFAYESYYCNNCVSYYRQFCGDFQTTERYSEELINNDHRRLHNKSDENCIQMNQHKYINCRLCVGRALTCLICHHPSPHKYVRIYHWTPTNIRECYVCIKCSESNKNELHKSITIISYMV